jgi:hypothetical protein
MWCHIEEWIKVLKDLGFGGFVPYTLCFSMLHNLERLDSLV